MAVFLFIVGTLLLQCEDQPHACTYIHINVCVCVYIYIYKISLHEQSLSMSQQIATIME